MTAPVLQWPELIAEAESATPPEYALEHRPLPFGLVAVLVVRVQTEAVAS
jgi:hypothetical protein